MATTDIITGVAWEGCDAVCMARIELNGTVITRDGVASISRKLYDLDSAAPTTATDTESLAVASVVEESLQTGNGWSKDATGYIFRDVIAGADLANGGHLYRAEYLFTGASDELFAVVFEFPLQELYSS